MQEIPLLSVGELVRAYELHELTPLDVVASLAERIENAEEQIHAFTTVCLDRATEEARRATDRLKRREPLGLLDGVPFATKDMLDSEGVRTTYGSPIFARHVPHTDADAVRRLRGVGAIMVGKTQTHEFAWGITTENRHFGTTRNPWNPGISAGGSSGGSAAALASGEVPLALGTDTGGSIRIPASFCGVFGHRPTFGLVRTDGTFSLAPSLDVVGVMARTVDDVGCALSVLCGRDGTDFERARGDLNRCRIGVDERLVAHGLVADAVAAAFERVCAALASSGAVLVPVTLPDQAVAYEAFACLQRAEALAVHRAAGLYPGQSNAYGREVGARLAAAERISAEEVCAAIRQREQVRAGWLIAFESVDFVLTPVSPAPPLQLGAGEVADAAFRAAVLPYNVAQSLAGLPACALAAGVDDQGLPVGVQLSGRPCSDFAVLGAAGALSECLPQVGVSWPVPSRSATAGGHAQGRVGANPPRCIQSAGTPGRGQEI